MMEKRQVGKEATQAARAGPHPPSWQRGPLDGAGQEGDVDRFPLEKGLQGNHGQQRRGGRVSCWETTEKAPNKVQMSNGQSLKQSADSGNGEMS